MKRDMDLIRQILIEAEKQPYGENIDEMKIEGYSPNEISYHIMLLSQAGYVKGFPAGSLWYVETLTWEGHEFLEASRDSTRWNKAKKLMKEKGGGIAFDVLKQLLLELMKSSVWSGLVK